MADFSPSGYCLASVTMIRPAQQEAAAAEDDDDDESSDDNNSDDDDDDSMSRLMNLLQTFKKGNQHG